MYFAFYINKDGERQAACLERGTLTQPAAFLFFHQLASPPPFRSARTCQRVIERYSRLTHAIYAQLIPCPIFVR